MVFSDRETAALMRSIRTTKGKEGLFFSFGFDAGSKDVFLCRGVREPISYKRNLLERKVKEIKAMLDKRS